MPYKAVVFDFDGTLVDSFENFVRAISAAAQRHRFTALDSLDAQLVRRLSPRQLSRRLQISSAKIFPVMRELKQHMSEQASSSKLFAGVGELFQALNEHDLQIAIITSQSRATVETILGPSLMARVQYLSCNTGISRKAQGLKQFLRDAALRPSEVLSVGDTISDAEAAMANRLDFVSVSWGYTHPELMEAYASARLPVLKNWEALLQLVTEEAAASKRKSLRVRAAS